MECDKFCPHRVFERRDGDVQLVVANPDNCVVFCRACAKTCGPDAITFPDKTADDQADQGPAQRGRRDDMSYAVLACNGMDKVGGRAGA